MKASYVQKEMKLKLQLCLFWWVYFLGLLIKALVWKMKDSLFLFMKSVKAAENLCLQEEVSLLCDWFYYVFVARKTRHKVFLLVEKLWLFLVFYLPVGLQNILFQSNYTHYCTVFSQRPRSRQTYLGSPSSGNSWFLCC